MLEAFVLAFWLIWSSERDMNILMESLVFMLLVMIMRGLISFQAPEINNLWFASMGVQWGYVAFVFWLVNRFSTGFATTLLYAAAGAGGYYWLALNATRLVEPYIV
jgi:hypothetical protein